MGQVRVRADLGGRQRRLLRAVQAVPVPGFLRHDLGGACQFVHSLPAASFDAPGHRHSLCNALAQIVGFIQANDLDQARSHLDKIISRSDGCAVRSAVDPKGAGQPDAADWIVNCGDQNQFYALLVAARYAL